LENSKIKDMSESIENIIRNFSSKLF
jgi:hypothetical protein